MFDKVKKLFGPQDMTQGSPVMAISKFAFPLLIGYFVQQLYSGLDSAVVRKYCTVSRNGYSSVDALSAVGASSLVLGLPPLFFIALSAGTGILAAQYFGAKEKERLSICIGTSVTMAVIAAGITMAVGIPFSRPLLVLLNTSEKSLDLAAAYLQISFLGILGAAIYNVILGALLGMGNSFYPLLCLLVSAAMNHVLDIWFVAMLGLGVEGAAWATVISQTVLAILCVIGLIFVKDSVEIKKMPVPKLNAAGLILKLALPFGMTHAVFFLESVLVQGLADRMGGVVRAANTTIARMNGFIVLPAWVFGLAVSVYIGQNLGAKKTDSLKPGEKAALMFAMSTYIVIALELLLFGRQLMGVFLDLLNQTSNSVIVYQEVIDLGGRELKILAAGYMALGIIQIYGGILRAAGDTVSMMVISLITTIVVRMPLAYTLAHFNMLGEWPNGYPDALYLSLPVSWLLGVLLVWLRYRQEKWKDIKLVGGEAESGEL